MSDTRVILTALAAPFVLAFVVMLGKWLHESGWFDALMAAILLLIFSAFACFVLLGVFP